MEAFERAFNESFKHTVVGAYRLRGMNISEKDSAKLVELLIEIYKDGFNHGASQAMTKAGIDHPRSMDIRNALVAEY